MTIPAASAQTTLKAEGETVAKFASGLADAMLKSSKTEILFSIDGQPEYILVEFSGGGYAIATRNGTVIEAAFDVASPYAGVNGDKYYVGPLNYVYGSKGNLRTVNDNKPISLSAAQKIQNKLSTSRQSTNAVTYASSVTKFVTYPGYIQTTDFGTNRGTTCGSVAAGIMLQYLDVYHNANVIPNTLGYGEPLHQSLIPYIEGSSGSTTMSVASGINNWKRSYSSASYTCNYMLLGHWSFVKGQINANKPAVLGLLSILGSPYGDHQVVAYGYETDQYNLNYYIVHLGWKGGSTRTYIGEVMAAGAAYVNF